MIHSLIISVILFAVWLMLSAHFTPLFFALGAVSVLLSVWIAYRMDVVEKEYPHCPIYLHPRMWLYSLWLLKEMIVSSVDTAKSVWSLRSHIEPAMARITSKQVNEVGQAIYANSITLTPGTVSIMVEENEILVHALKAGSIEVLKEGEMDQRVLAFCKNIYAKRS